MHFADLLTARMRELRAPVCVGIDPQLHLLPRELREHHRLDPLKDRPPVNPTERQAAADAIVAHGMAVLDAVANVVPAVKINIAFFEPMQEAGLTAYRSLVSEAHRRGLLVIGDVKRADIGHTSTMYAWAHLGAAGVVDDSLADAITINPYFGVDGVEPFIAVARATGRGLFVLVRTSNPSAAHVQGLPLADGGTLGERVATQVDQWSRGEGLVGGLGFSLVGAVVAPRDVRAAREARERMPHCLFLVPGYGAQGLSAADVASCFRPDGTGAIVNASRSVIYAYDQPRYRERSNDWKQCITDACAEFVHEIRAAVHR